jgi:glyoxylase-like metal-dependent hydrolase (beta-lactamase superfamily II)
MELTILKLEQVSKNSWAIVDASTYGNVGCIKQPESVAVIDTGMTPPLAKQFRKLIHKEVGEPITEVILTHYHSDHVFGTQVFQDCTLITSSTMAAMYPELLKDRWSPEGIKELKEYYAQNDPAFAKQLKDLRIVTPTQTFEDSMTLGTENEIHIQHTGGHTAGHSTVYLSTERVLFAGDLVFCQQYPYAGDPTNNPLEWMHAFEEILKMPVEIIVPGHGPLCGKEEIQTQLTYFKKLETWIKAQLREEIPLDKVLKTVESSPKPPYDLKTDPRLNFSIERWYTFYSQDTS